MFEMNNLLCDLKIVSYFWLIFSSYIFKKIFLCVFKFKYKYKLRLVKDYLYLDYVLALKQNNKKTYFSIKLHS